MTQGQICSDAGTWKRKKWRKCLQGSDTVDILPVKRYMTLTTNGSEVGSSYQGYFERPGAIPGREMTLGPHGSSEGRWQACIMTPKPNSPHITDRWISTLTEKALESEFYDQKYPLEPNGDDSSCFLKNHPIIWQAFIVVCIRTHTRTKKTQIFIKGF